MNTTLIKAAINKSFSQKASAYEDYANVQGRAAQILSKFLQEELDNIPQGQVLELGCGTGIFTSHLINMLAGRKIVASDASQCMLDQCKLMLAPMSAQLELALLDAEECGSEQSLALIAASFSLQWVTDFYATLGQLLKALKPGGQLIFSIPLSGSFDQWRTQCLRADVPFTANTLPDKTKLIGWCEEQSVTLAWTQQPVVCRYNSALEFFQSLKGVGASVNTGDISLTTRQLRHLIQTWDKSCNNDVRVTYNVLCGRIMRGDDQ